MVEHIEVPEKKGRKELLRVVVEKVGDVYRVYEEIQTNWPFGIKTKRREYMMHSTGDGHSWNTTYTKLKDAEEVAESLEKKWGEK